MRLLIVEDHIAFLEGIEEYLKTNLGNDWIIDSTSNGATALQKFNQGETYDVLLTDLNLPGMNGAELIKEVKKRYPSLRVVMLTMYYSRAILSKLKDLGISGFLTKNVSRTEILDTIVNSSKEDCYVTDEIKGLFKDYFLEEVGDGEEDKSDLFVRTFSLSKRELEVMDLVVENKSNAEIGEQIFVSAETVKSHRKNIYRKMGVNNVLDLYKLLISKGYVEIN